jgi:hypothetical protein
VGAPRTRGAVILVGFALLVACRALPSEVPLSNAGGVLEDNGTDRDRRPQSAGTAATQLADSKPAPLATSHAPPLPTVDAPLDGGALASAVASSDTGAAVVWAGEYYGSDRLVRHFDGEADDVELDDKAHTRVEQTSTAALVISIVNSATGETICALHATVQGTTAALDAGQPCFGDDGSNATVTDGNARASGDRLTLDFDGKVVENGGDGDDDDDTIEFHLDYHFDGRRR